MRHLLAAAVVLVLSSAGFAADRAPVTVMAEPGKLLFSDDFGSGLRDGYRAAKGKWSVENGVLKAVELKDDQHAAVLRHDLQFTDAVFQYDFKLADGKATHLSLNDAAGHVCRVTITPAGFSIRRDKPNKKSDVKPLRLASVEQKFEPGQWYTMTLEVVGQEMVAHVDAGHVAYGGDELVARPKTNFGLPSSGEATYFDNLRVWEASAKRDWPARRQEITARRATVAR